MWGERSQHDGQSQQKHRDSSVGGEDLTHEHGGVTEDQGCPSSREPSHSALGTQQTFPIHSQQLGCRKRSSSCLPGCTSRLLMCQCGQAEGQDANRAMGESPRVHLFCRSHFSCG